jgi:hypothetical protein
VVAGTASSTCRSQLAGDSDLTDAIVGTPPAASRLLQKNGNASDIEVHIRPVGAGLLAMAISQTPSPASRLLQKNGNARDIEVHTVPVGASLLAMAISLAPSVPGAFTRAVAAIKQAFHRVDGSLLILSVRSFAHSVQSPDLPPENGSSTAGSLEKSHAHR